MKPKQSLFRIAIVALASAAAAAADSVITAKVKVGSDQRPGRKATRPPSAYLPNQQTDHPYKEGHETARKHETLRG